MRLTIEREDRYRIRGKRMTMEQANTLVDVAPVQEVANSLQGSGVEVERIDAGLRANDPSGIPLQIISPG